MLFTVSWLLGSISVTTYLAGILRTIPRMHFYRQNPEYKTLYLPSLQNTTIIYFCYIFTIGITLTTCSFFIGYLETNPNSIVIAYVLKSVEFSVFAICCFLMSFGYIIYGSKLISIASEGIHLLEGVNDYQSHIKSKNSRNTTHSLSGLELEIKHKRLKRSVRKVVTNNRIILAASAIFCKQLYENLISNKVFAAFTNLFPMLVNVAVMAGIAYGEMTVHNKYEIGFENNITSSISTNNPLPPRESIETIAVHTRDPSTDSESPLLLLPPPVILSTMYHHNHYGGSGGNNGNGNLSNNIRSNNISSNDLRSNNSRNDISSNNISRNDIYRNNNGGRSSFATTTSSLNSPINSTPMRINYSYI
ncbi:6633_t:CDS:2 [Entrophospora sp. SA101]|nr:6633_t:CDS:2 [Entrophospora sp. SA101]